MTWEKKEIEDALLDLPIVEYVSARISSGLICRSTSYEAIVKCDLTVASKSAAVTVCIPRYWQTRLFDVYLEDASEYPFMPHVDVDGKICLVDLDSTLIDGDGDRWYGLLSECIRRSAQILADGLTKANSDSLVAEFDSYWRRFPSCRLGKLDVSRTQSAKVITFAAISSAGVHNSNRKRRRTGGVRRQTYTTTQEEFSIVASETMAGFSYWGGRGTQRNGAYFCIESPDFVYPPDTRKSLTAEYLRYLLSLVPSNDKRRVLRKCSESTVLVFDVNQPTGVTSLVAALVEDGVAKMAYGMRSRPMREHQSPIATFRNYYMRGTGSIRGWPHSLGSCWGIWKKSGSTHLVVTSGMC